MASFVQASPVDEDTSGPGFSGNYGGKQGSAKAVFALLETISSDFDRTLRKTEEAENKAHREYVEFSQAAESSIAGRRRSRTWMSKISRPPRHPSSKRLMICRLQWICSTRHCR